MKNKAKANMLRLIVSAIITNLCCCMADTNSLVFTPLKDNQWNHDDTLTFTIPPLGKEGENGISILIHTETYDYTNIAVNISISQDTILYNHHHEFILNECSPIKGIGERYDYTLPVTNIPLCDTLPTTITLTQQLNQRSLSGVREVGILISSPFQQSEETTWKVKW